MNYISIIHREHLEKPYYFGRSVGRTIVWNRLLDCILEDLRIDPKELGHIDFLYQVDNKETLRRMIESLCESMNQVSNSEAREMEETGMLFFIIMEIWNSLKLLYAEQQREDALSYLMSLIENDVIISLIESMNKHFNDHHLRGESSANQF